MSNEEQELVDYNEPRSGGVGLKSILVVLFLLVVVGSMLYFQVTSRMKNVELAQPAPSTNEEITGGNEGAGSGGSEPAIGGAWVATPLPNQTESTPIPIEATPSPVPVIVTVEEPTRAEEQTNHVWIFVLALIAIGLSSAGFAYIENSWSVEQVQTFGHEVHLQGYEDAIEEAVDKAKDTLQKANGNANQDSQAELELQKRKIQKVRGVYSVDLYIYLVLVRNPTIKSFWTFLWYGGWNGIYKNYISEIKAELTDLGLDYNPSDIGDLIRQIPGFADLARIKEISRRTDTLVVRVKTEKFEYQARTVALIEARSQAETDKERARGFLEMVEKGGTKAFLALVAQAAGNWSQAELLKSQVFSKEQADKSREAEEE